MSRVAVLIPALDEEAALPAVLEAIPAWVDRTIVVDNGSTDGTGEVARAGGAEVVAEPRRGYGSACLAGIDHLEHHGSTPGILVFMDADGSDDPGDMERLVEPIRRGSADLVLGVRRSVDDVGTRSGVGTMRDVGTMRGVGTLLPHARLGNRIVLTLTRLLFGRAFRDLPPFRAVRFSSLRAMEMDDRDWGWTLQMQIRAVRAGLRIEELEVAHRRRSEGVSKISGSLSMSLRVGAKMFWTLARERAR